MTLLLTLIFVIPLLFIMMLFLSDYKVFLFLALISYFFNKDLNSFSYFCLFVAFIKFITRNKYKNKNFYTYKFYTNSNFRNNYYKGNNSEYSDFKNDYYENDNLNYEKACRFFGFSKDTPIEQKKKVYKEMAKKYHPDLNKSSDAEEMTKKINENWDIIEKYNS